MHSKGTLYTHIAYMDEKHSYNTYYCRIIDFKWDNVLCMSADSLYKLQLLLHLLLLVYNTILVTGQRYYIVLYLGYLYVWIMIVEGHKYDNVPKSQTHLNFNNNPNEILLYTHNK